MENEDVVLGIEFFEDDGFNMGSGRIKQNYSSWEDSRIVTLGDNFDDFFSPTLQEAVNKITGAFSE